MLEIPNLNVIYEDEYVTCLIHDIAGEGKLYVFHADVIPTTDRKLLQHYRNVMFKIDDALRAKGLTEIEAWVNTEEEMRYAAYFGFGEYIGELTVNRQRCLPEIHRLKKRLV